MKRSLIHRQLLVVAFALCSIFLSGYGPPKLTDREIGTTRRLSVGELRQWAEATHAAEFSADALLLYDVDADRIVYERNWEAALPPASLTKLMTALLVLEDGRLQDTVSIVADDLVDGASMHLEEGDTLLVNDLLAGMLISSGNDAAMALARHTGGTVDEFVALMNRRADEMEFHDTRFANPHGLDADGHVTSARDILALTQQLFEYPLFAEIVATQYAEIDGRQLHNTNELLGSYPGADGVKTGTTPAAGECLVASLTRDGHQVLIVILGSDNRYQDARQLYELFLANYMWTGSEADGLTILNRVYGEDGQVWFMQPEGEKVAALIHRYANPRPTGFSSCGRASVGNAYWWTAGWHNAMANWRLCFG